MGIDPLLYLALGIGFAAGRIYPRRSPWVGRATVASIVVLVALLGDSLAEVPTASLLSEIPLAVGFAGVLLGLTMAIVMVLPHDAPAQPPSPGPVRRRVPLELVLIVALGVGYGLLSRLGGSPDIAIPWVLYLMLALVAFDLRLDVAAVRRAWVPITAAVTAALVAAVLVTAIGFTTLPVGLAIAGAFGWYTLAGPLVGAAVGPSLGLVAFLTNYLRELGTMVVAEPAGRYVGGEGIAALGGATSMDTTLYFAIRAGGPPSAGTALATGLVLTLGAGLVLPLLLASAGG